VHTEAMFAEATTHVLLDVVGFTRPGFEYSKVTVESPVARASRLQRAQQAMRRAGRPAPPGRDRAHGR